MKRDRNIYIELILFCLIAVVTGFIFFNSVKDYQESHNYSNSIADIIVSAGEKQNVAIETIIRKAAHVIEYAILGVAVMALTLHIKQAFQRTFVGTSLFYTLAVAVADEHIQSYSGRTSSTGDIILDFCGAVIGFFVGWIIIKSYTYIKHRCKRKQEVN